MIETAAFNSQRVRWVDVCKGVLVSLVVFHHTLTAVVDSGGFPFLRATDSIVSSVRMPSLILLSGLFAAGVVHGKPGRLWRDRVGQLFYLAFLWSAIAVLVGAIGAFGLHRSILESFFRFAERMSDGVQPLWFLIALGFFYTYARVLRQLPRHLQLLIGVSIACLVLLLPELPGIVRHVWYLPFFLVGLHYSNVILKVGSLTGIECVGSGWVGRLWAWVGRRTLAVFLVHAVLLPFVVRVIPSSALGVLLGATALILFSLLARKAFGRVPGLFNLPPSLGRR